jgi:membrane protein YqaA with SNARE-associated domain
MNDPAIEAVATGAPVAPAATRPGLFGRAYAWMERSSQDGRAPWLLALVAFTEAFVFPLPPDIMLVPMTLAQPRRWFFFASLTTLTSSAGGIIGWLIGALLIEQVMPLIVRLGQANAYASAHDFFLHYGFWAMLVKGLTPIPFKIFTIAAGAAKMPILPFIAASIIGRGMRFYLVAGAMRVAGPSIEPALKRYIEIVGWVVIGLVIAGFAWITWSHAT